MSPDGAAPDELLSALRTALGAQYAVERLLGKGGMGSVFLARDVTLDRPVAIKVINPEIASNATLRERFLQEARTVAKLRHPNIVPVYAAGEAAGVLYFVMEFVPGESLRDVLAREKRITGERAERMLREVAMALGHAHTQGLVHRDVKPENILLDAESGRAMLTDFGVARAFEQDGGATQTGMILGSPRYMSPEQASGDRTLDGRSDLYSLALVGYEMYAGAPVVQAGTAAAMLVKHLTETPAPLAEKAQDMPAEVANAIDRGLAKEPERRWQTGHEFAEALAGHALTPAGELSGGVRRAPARLRRTRWMIAAGVAAVVLAGWLTFVRGGVTGTAYLVTPFEIQTGDKAVEWLHDGSVNMLTLTLGQWGDLQVVDYERTLSLLDKAGLGTKARLSLDDALSLARRARAGTVVTGQIQTIHDSLIVVAKLYDVRSGKSKNQAQEASAIGGDPRAVFDRLAQKLLQIAGGPTSTLQLASATTTSIEAYRAYLNGVKLLNGWRLADADTAFQHAIDVDSTFALAYHKYSLSMGWSGDVGVTKYLTVADRALALAGRLPARERALVVGHNHLAHALSKAGGGDTAKIRAEFDASIKAYSDLFARGDTLAAEAWYGQADAYFHARTGAITNAQMVNYTTRALRGFNRTLAIDSTFYLAYSHLIQIYNASAAQSFMLVSGDSVLPAAEGNEIQALGGAAGVQKLRDAAGVRGIDVARAWTRADPGSAQAALQLSQSFSVAGKQDSAIAVLRDALRGLHTGQRLVRMSMLSLQTSIGDSGLTATVRYVLDKFTRDSLREVPVGQRFSDEGDLMGAAASIGRGADVAKAAQLAYAADSTLPGSTLSSSYIFDFYKDILRVGMGEEMTPAVKRNLADGLRGLDSVPAPLGEQARGGSISVPYLAFLASRDTVFLATFKRWSKGPTPELDALVALGHGDTATAMKLAKAFPRPDSLLKAGARYSLAGMRGVARAEVLTQLGLARQAAETYDAMKADHLQRTALAEPGFAVWVRSLLAKARLWKQVGERDKAISAYEEFIARWKDADGAAAKLVGQAKQELGQLRDAPRKQ